MDKTGQTIGSCIATAVTRTHVLTSAACLKDNNGQNSIKNFTFKKPNESIHLFDCALAVPLINFGSHPPNKFFEKLSNFGILFIFQLTRLNLSINFFPTFFVGKTFSTMLT